MDFPGLRSNAEVFIVVDVEKALGDGIVFYKSANNVILTAGVDGWLAPKYFKRAMRYDRNTNAFVCMDLDTNEAAPCHGHGLGHGRYATASSSRRGRNTTVTPWRRTGGEGGFMDKWGHRYGLVDF